MPLAQESLDRFMSSYECNTENADPAAVAGQFADPFLAAGPEGSIVVPAAVFARNLPGRKRLFDSAGLKNAKVVDRRDTMIGDRYVLVDTQWQMDFNPKGELAVSITVSSSFLIDMGGTAPKILVYLPHRDIFQLLRNQGLLPAE